MAQPCLPVPRRRKRDQSDGGNIQEFNEIDTMDAMEYIAAVAKQAECLPDVFVASAPESSPLKPKEEREEYFDGSKASLSYLLSPHTMTIAAPSRNHLPQSGKKWVDSTLTSFSNLRMYIEKCFEMGIGSKETMERIPCPPMKDRSGWHIFCLGEQEAMGNVGGYFDDEMEENDLEGNEMEEDDVDNTESGNDWVSHVPQGGHETSVRILAQMDQVMTRRILSHHVHYMEEGWVLSKKRTAWIYALLARIERPLHRDDAAMMHDLLKECTKRRATCHCEEQLAMLNTLISIVGIYFEQGGGYQALMVAKIN